MSRVDEFRALPAEVRTALAVEVLEYLLDVAYEEERDDDTDAAATALCVGLEHVLLDAPAAFQKLSGSAAARMREFCDAVQEDLA